MIQNNSISKTGPLYLSENLRIPVHVFIIFIHKLSDRSDSIDTAPNSQNNEKMRGLYVNFNCFDIMHH